MDPTLLVAFIGVLGVVITALFNRSGKRYDQLQEDLNAERVQRQLDIQRIHMLIDAGRKKDDYIVDLRQHIIDQRPPPPPPWPEGLG